jgi:anti-sigma factor ChrR (cupin superfamily)
VRDLSGCIEKGLTQEISSMSTLIDPAAMDWTSTRFEGIYIKPLMRNSETGLVTVLMRMDPGAVLPEHEHVKVEQTFVLDGHLVDLTGPDKGLECKAGQFVWREAGSIHSAHSPNGGVFIAAFQVPNKFFDSEGKVLDISGEPWDLLWSDEGRA